jgi:hypothetical protein
VKRVYNDPIAGRFLVQLGGIAVNLSHRRATASGGVYLGVAAVVAAACLARPAAADVTAPAKASPEQIAILIRELGHERFATRESASDRLARIGLPAFAALEEATRTGDREVRFRAERILNRIRKSDLERRLAAFIAGTGGDDYELPAWDRFQKRYGDSEVSRRMFVEMQRAEPELLATLQRDPRAAVEVLGRRLQERSMIPVRGVGQMPGTVSTPELSAFLFVAAEEDTPVSTNSQYFLLQFCRQPAFSEALRSPQDGELAKKILGGVIRRAEGEASLYAMQLAIDYELKDGLTPALKIIEQHGTWNAASGTMAIMALGCVASTGDASHVPLLEKLLDNQTQIYTSSVRVVQNGQPTMITKEVQVRDAALASLVMLTKQDMKDYYDEAENARVAASRRQPLQVQVIGFDVKAPQKREAALKKWADYKARQKPKDPAVQPASAQQPVPDKADGKPAENPSP